MSHPVLLIRADASADIGGGHVMRCLALGQAWQDQGGKACLLGDVPEGLRQRLGDENIEYVPLASQIGSQQDTQETLALAGKLGASCVAADSYALSSDFQQAVVDADLPLLFLDDNGHCDRYVADWVLNQNIHANESFYANRCDRTKLLLGPRYALLRREFRKLTDFQREIPSRARRLLVTLGAGRSGGLGAKVLQALSQLSQPFQEVIYVVGPANREEQELRAQAGQLGLDIEFRSNVRDMTSLLYQTDMAITAGGSTCWEMACLGLPSIVIVLAENQRANAAALAKWGSCLTVGEFNSLIDQKLSGALAELVEDVPAREKMSKRGQELVDGVGACRVTAALHPEAKLAGLNLREVYERDRRLLWEWANDSSARRYYFNQDPVSWEEHCRWFSNQFDEQDVQMYIMETQYRIPVGLVRFKIAESGQGCMEISLQIDRYFRGLGLGLGMIRSGHEAICRRMKVSRIDAWVLELNKPSLRLFARAGYKLVKKDVVRGRSAMLFSWYPED